MKRAALALAGGLMVPATATLPVGACGGGAVCGDGRPEGGEECDDGNERDDDACSNDCKQRETLDAQVLWKLAAQEVPGFEESCSGVQAAKIKLDIAGPMSFTQEVDCAFSQYLFRALVPGVYTVTGTLYDGAGGALTKGQAQAGFEIGAQDVQVTVNFPFSDFIRTDYTGDWFYKFSWGGVKTCDGAVPPVAMTRIRLERGGAVIMDEMGTPIDGMTPGPCYNASDAIARAVNDLPWGKADATITGLDAMGEKQFEGTFVTFIGAGISNPAFEPDVPSLAPDAGPADAGPVDPADAAPADGG